MHYRLPQIRLSLSRPFPSSFTIRRPIACRLVGLLVECAVVIGCRSLTATFEADKFSVVSIYSERHASVCKQKKIIKNHQISLICLYIIWLL